MSPLLARCPTSFLENLLPRFLFSSWIFGPRPFSFFFVTPLLTTLKRLLSLFSSLIASYRIYGIFFFRRLTGSFLSISDVQVGTGVSFFHILLFSIRASCPLPPPLHLKSYSFRFVTSVHNCSVFWWVNSPFACWRF